MQLKYIFGRIKSASNIKGYNDMSLQGKLTVTHIVLLLFPIIIYFLIFNIYIDNIRKEELSLISQLNMQAVDSIDVYIRDLEQLTKQPLYTFGTVNEVSVYSVLNSASPRGKASIQYSKDKEKKSNPNSINEINSNISYEEYNFIRTLLNKLVQSKKYLYSAFLFDSKGAMVSYVMPNGQLFKPYNAKEQDWFTKSMLLSGKPVVSRSIRFNNSYLIKPEKFYAFSVSRAIVEPNTVEKIGVISLFADISIFRDTLSKIKSVEGEQILIVDPQGLIIYDINEENISKPFNMLDRKIISAIGENSGNKNDTVAINGQNYMVMSAWIETPQWKFIRIMPEEALYSNKNRVEKRMIILIISFTLLSLVSSIVMSFGITRPLKKLNLAMKVVEKGDLSVRFKARYNDEVGQLGRSFNNMLVEIDNLIYDVYITKTRKKEAELNALQMQINPHFIYNSLESIRMMAIVNDDTDSAEMILILGKLLRYSINIKNQLVKVKDEIEHLKTYIILQNHRFENRFVLNMEITGDLYDVNIIKLVFQPIVENAIFHALETVDEKGVITVRGAFGEEGIFFEIEDNGIGMTEEQTERLIQHANDFTTVKGNSHGVGLKNVNERIKLYYGEEYGLNISSKLGKGTIVRLDLPDKESMNNVKIHYN